jgi:hypothetical protein
MNEQISGQIRHLLTAIGGAIVANGWAGDATVQISIGVIMAVVGFVWSYRAKKKG